MRDPYRYAVPAQGLAILGAREQELRVTRAPGQVGDSCLMSASQDEQRDLFLPQVPNIDVGIATVIAGGGQLGRVVRVPCKRHVLGPGSIRDGVRGLFGGEAVETVALVVKGEDRLLLLQIPDDGLSVLDRRG